MFVKLLVVAPRINVIVCNCCANDYDNCVHMVMYCMVYALCRVHLDVCIHMLVNDAKAIRTSIFEKLMNPLMQNNILSIVTLEL